MESLNTLRWNRIKESGIQFTYIKSIVKNLYDYEVKENNIDSFINNIKDYKNIEEGILILNIEKDIYRKLRIFSMKDLKKYDKHPIEEVLTNPMFKMVFENKNRININAPGPAAANAPAPAVFGGFFGKFPVICKNQIGFFRFLRGCFRKAEKALLFSWVLRYNSGNKALAHCAKRRL